MGQSPFVHPSTVLPDAFTPVSVTPVDWIVAAENGVVYVPMVGLDKAYTILPCQKCDGWTANTT